MAWPASAGASAAGGSGAPSATRSCSSTRSRPGHELGHGMLDLQPRVHLQEPEPAVRLEEELDRAGAHVADGPRRGDGGVAHLPAQLGVDGGGGALLDDLLVAPLDRALPLVQCGHVAVLVGEHLDLDVAAALDVALGEHGAVAEGRPRLPLGGGERVGEIVGGAHDAHAPSAAAGRRLDEQRQADGVEALDARVGEHRHAGGPHHRLGPDLRPHRGDRRRRRTDPRQSGGEDRLGERRRLGEEPVAGMDGIGAGPRGGVDEEVAAEVGVRRGVAGQGDGGVAQADVARTGVGVAVHGDRLDAQAPARADDAAGDLAAVGDQQTLDHAVTSGTRRSRVLAVDLVVVDHRQAHPEHRAGVARVEQPVVVQPAGHEQGQRLALDLVLDGGPHRRVGLLVERPAHRGGGLPGDDRQHAGELLRAHHRRLRVGPREQEARAVRPAAHAVVPGAVAGAPC